jgi:hypothetical protein
LRRKAVAAAAAAMVLASGCGMPGAFLFPFLPGLGGDLIVEGGVGLGRQPFDPPLPNGAVEVLVFITDPIMSPIWPDVIRMGPASQKVTASVTQPGQYRMKVPRGNWHFVGWADLNGNRIIDTGDLFGGFGWMGPPNNVPAPPFPIRTQDILVYPYNEHPIRVEGLP